MALGSGNSGASVLAEAEGALFEVSADTGESVAEGRESNGNPRGTGSRREEVLELAALKGVVNAAEGGPREELK